ncbi:chromosome segregation protein SMC, partial [Micromonospora aurantiaca]
MPTSPAQAPTVPAHVLPHRTPAQLLAVARDGRPRPAR